MSNETKTLTDVEAIKAWAEEHGAEPATVQTADENSSILRFTFGENENLTVINWEHFEELFKENNLALLVSESESSPNFNKFVSRNQS